MQLAQFKKAPTGLLKVPSLCYWYVNYRIHSFNVKRHYLGPFDITIIIYQLWENSKTWRAKEWASYFTKYIWCTTNKKCSAYNKILKSSVYIKYKLAFNECSSTVYLAAYVFIIHGWAHTMLNSMLISSLALREAINCSELNTTPSLMKRLFTMAKAKAFWVSATKVAFYPPNGALDWESTVAKPSTGK